MKELLTYIAKNLVDNPDEVSVTEKETDSETVFEVRVAEGDMGKIIGRQGRIVKEIRVLMRAVAQRQGKTVSVEIMTEVCLRGTTKSPLGVFFLVFRLRTVCSF